MLILVVVLIVVVGAFVLSSIQSSTPAESRIPPEQIDLDSVRDAVIEKQGWSLERANSAREEYVRFLTLLQMKPGFMLVPWPNAEGQDDLDQFWHQHILDTAKYSADCDRVFGRMIHHNPHVVKGSGQETDSVEKTQRLYARTFGSGSYGSQIAPIFLASCSSCAADDSASHGNAGHSGHGDSGHGGASHSCGSHSCGHGCGHGCGGH